MPVISKLLGVNWIFKTLMQSLYQASQPAMSSYLSIFLFVKKKLLFFFYTNQFTSFFFVKSINLLHFTSKNISKNNTKWV
jgi:hypothetical protein